MRRPKEPLAPLDGDHFDVVGGCIVRHAYSERRGSFVRKVTSNFVARITSATRIDSHGAVEPILTIEGTMGDGRPLPEIEVTAAEWERLDWIPANWGPNPRIESGQRGVLCSAIQALSGDRVPTRTVYAHAGFRRIKDARGTLGPKQSAGMVFLMPARCSGVAIGTSDQVEIEPLDAPYQASPRSPTRAELRDALQHSLKFLDLAPDEVSALLFAAHWTAPLATALRVNFSVWICGASGEGKSGLVGALMRHWGAFGHDRHSLQWTSTFASIESTLYRCKDLLVSLDDYVPGQCDDEVVGKVIQMIGDRLGRARSNADLSQTKARAPRGLAVCTAEAFPVTATDSGPGRCVIVHLTGATAEERARRIASIRDYEARGDALSALLRGYVEWLLTRGDAWWTALDGRREALAAELRADFAGCHPRTPRNIATLLIGAETFAAFACDVAPDVDATSLVGRLRGALLAVGRLQAIDVGEANPAARYLGFLAQLIDGGAVQLVKVRGSETRGLDSVTDAVGWLDGETVYLDPAKAWPHVVAAARRNGEPWPHRRRAVERALGLPHNEGHLTLAVKIGGRARKVLPIPLSRLRAATE